MTVSAEAKKNWGKLPNLFDQGIETLPQLLVYQARHYRDRTFHRKKDFGIWQEYSWAFSYENVRDFALGLHRPRHRQIVPD